MRSSRTGKVSTGVVALALVSLALSGCSSTPTSQPTIDASTPSTSSTDSPPPASTPSSTSTLSGTPLTLGCNQILTLQNVYDYNPNYGANPNFSVPEQIAPLTKIGGVACGWINQTSSDTFSVGIAKPDATSMTLIANAAASTYTAVPTYGTSPIEGYFGMSGSIGVATVFTNGYWIVLTSDAFMEPGDAAPLMASLLANLS